MLIGAVAKDSGVDARTLRFWEAEGLLAEPERTPAGYRDFDERVLTRIGFIRQAQGAGLRLADIRQLLELHDSGEAPCGRVSELLAAQLSHVEERIVELQGLRGRLRDLLSSRDVAATTPRAICPIIGTG